MYRHLNLSCLIPEQKHISRCWQEQGAAITSENYSCLRLVAQRSRGKHSRDHLIHKPAQPSRDPSSGGLLSPCATSPSWVSKLLLEASKRKSSWHIKTVFTSGLPSLSFQKFSKYFMQISGLKPSQNKTYSSAHFVIKPVTKFFHNKILAE